MEAGDGLTAERLIGLLGLVPLPVEGGFFRQTYESDETLPAGALPARYGRPKTFATAIYYLLTSDADSFSALHRLPTEEVYHYYLGDPVEMLLLHPDGRSERAVLGQDLLGGQHVQQVVPRGVLTAILNVPHAPVNVFNPSVLADLAGLIAMVELDTSMV